MKKITIIIALIAITSISFGQAPPKEKEKVEQVVNITDSTAFISIIDLNRLYVFLGDEIPLASGGKKVFSANDRELILDIINRVVISPAAEAYRKKMALVKPKK